MELQPTHTPSASASEVESRASPSDDNNSNIAHQIEPVSRRKQSTVLLSSFLTIFITIGLNQCYGVFQSYYVSGKADVIPRSQAGNNALLAFIGTLGSGLTWAGSIFVNPLMARVCDMRKITVPGALLMCLGLGLASLSTQVSCFNLGGRESIFAALGWCWRYID